MVRGGNMTVVVKIGRRIPKNFYKKIMYKTQGFLSFQENIWIMISRSLQMAKNAADKKPEEQVNITLKTIEEPEGFSYVIQWRILTITSPIQAKELEEYNAAMGMYDKFSVLKTLFKKNIESNDDFKKSFKSTIVTEEQFKKAKEAGMGALEHKNIANKLLELGIFTLIEKDFDVKDEKI